jgi:chromatin assembly factor 1 subunit B
LAGGHQKTVNCVRFSPSGQFLASGSDDQMVVVWSLKSVPVEFGKVEEMIRWGHPRQLRGHVGDVMDLSWSADSSYLVSGSLDGTAIVWQVSNGKFGKVQTLEGHKKFVQGVAMHPLLKMVATASSDATVRIYKNRKLKNQLQFFHKFTVKQREDLEDKNTANYVNEIQE